MYVIILSVSLKKENGINTQHIDQADSRTSIKK